MIIDLPIRTVPETNAHEHWRYRQKRAKAQRHAVNMLFTGRRLPSLPALVTLTRIAPRSMDRSDNLNASFKHVRDEIAAQYRIDDRTPRIAWDYDQVKGAPRHYAVRVEILTFGRVEPDYFGLWVDQAGQLRDASQRVILPEAPARLNLFLDSHSRALTGEQILHFTLNDHRLRRIRAGGGDAIWDAGSASVSEVLASFRELKAEKAKRAAPAPALFAGGTTR